jgi:bifunctional non-homologous end joining protein LigD
MLATLVERPFSRDGWLFERKLDGERCLAVKQEEEVHLFSRNRKLLNTTYPELVGALLEQAMDSFVVDGEIVAFEGRETSFSRLQRRMPVAEPSAALRRDVPVFYYLFDLVHLDGYDTRSLPLRQRKSLLREALHFAPPLRYVTHRNTTGDALFAAACHWGWEGVLAKRADSGYVPGRSRDWLKFKCLVRQEFLVGGYTDPRGARAGFGALLLGDLRDGALVYVGKVGTGFDEETLARISRELGPLARGDSPFDASGDAVGGVVVRGAAAPSSVARGVHWVEPVLLADVAFTEWTNDGHLRHPRFLGLRQAPEPPSGA